MPKFTVTCQSHNSSQEAFQRVRQILEEDQELKKLDAKIAYHFDPSSLKGTAKGQYFQAELKVDSHPPGSKVNIAVELPFHLALAKGMVQKTLQRKLDEALLT